MPDAGSGVGVRHFFDGEEFFCLGPKRGWVELAQAVNDAMSGQDQQSVGIHIDECHHDRRFRVGWMGQLGDARFSLGRCGGGVLAGISQRGLIAMMAVGDDQFFVRHGADQQPNYRRVIDAPDAVQDSVLVGDFGVSRTHCHRKGAGPRWPQDRSTA